MQCPSRDEWLRRLDGEVTANRLVGSPVAGRPANGRLAGSSQFVALRKRRRLKRQRRKEEHR